LRYIEGANTAAAILDETAAEGRVEAWSNSYTDILEKNRLFNEA
jgi:hypothetical protein